MKGYCLFDCLQISEGEDFETYKKEVVPLVEKYEGQYIINKGKVITIEGEWKPSFLVMIEFPSYEKAMAWYNSSAYLSLKKLRSTFSISNGIIVEGTKI